MSAVEVRVPDLGDFSAVDVIEVHVKPGDRISADDPLVTLETDKATMDVAGPPPRPGVWGGRGDGGNVRADRRRPGVMAMVAGTGLC